MSNEYDANNPLFELARQSALRLLFYVHEIELADKYEKNAPIDFEKEKIRFLNSMECINLCGKKIGKNSYLFCSKYCEQVAITIRYARRHRGTRAADIEFQRGLGDLLIFLGYPAQERALSKMQREEIFKRDNYICCICKENPAQEIDHKNGSSNDPSNLQALCKKCHSEKTFSNPGSLTSEEAERLEDAYRNMATRVASPFPLMLCDDEQWKIIWPKIQQTRKQQLLALEMENQGITDDFITDFFDEVFGNSTIVCKLIKAKKELTCDAGNHSIPKGTLYTSRRQAKACIDCLIDYRDGDGWEDVDGYLAHTMSKE